MKICDYVASQQQYAKDFARYAIHGQLSQMQDSNYAHKQQNQKLEGLKPLDMLDVVQIMGDYDRVPKDHDLDNRLNQCTFRVPFSTVLRQEAVLKYLDKSYLRTEDLADLFDKDDTWLVTITNFTHDSGSWITCVYPEGAYELLRINRPTRFSDLKVYCSNLS